jgi:hypothetical protein
LFIYKNCSNSNFVHIRKLFKFNFYSYMTFVRIWKLFIYNFLFKFENCSNLNFGSCTNFCSNLKIVLFLKMSRSKNIWIKQQQKEKKKEEKQLPVIAPARCSPRRRDLRRDRILHLSAGYRSSWKAVRAPPLVPSPGLLVSDLVTGHLP